MHTASSEWAARVAARNTIEVAKARGRAALPSWDGQAWQPSLFNAARDAEATAARKEVV